MLATLLLAASVVEWPNYGNDPGGTRHSSASQITPANVSRLKTAWTWSAGDMYPGNPGRPSALESTPIYADGTLYVTSSQGRVVALDPETARELWSYDPRIKVDAGWGDFTNRGVALH